MYDFLTLIPISISMQYKHILFHYKIYAYIDLNKRNKMNKMNLAMYTQMGYTQAQVNRAYDYSQRNRMDIFDALQHLQNQEYNQQDRTTQANIPSFSYLKSINNVNIKQFEVLFSRNKGKITHYNRDQLRQPNVPVGLFNVSNCCYLNSLLQCYFLMGSFVRQILVAEHISELPLDHSAIKIKRIKNEYLLLGALKQIFSKMKLSSRRYLDPTLVLKNLVNSVGQKIEYGDEKDLHEINMEIIERLSECLMYTKKYYVKSDGSPSKIKKRQNIKNLFYGEKVQLIQGSEQLNISDFLGFILNPKHNNIIFALNEQFNYDVQINGKILKKHAYIRTLPKFLFITISRLEIKGNQIRKNSEKISFDFVLYLDQYLEANKQQSRLKQGKINQLHTRKTIIKIQLNHLNILAQKLEQCRVHAKFLNDWVHKLPKNDEIEEERRRFNREIQQIQQELSKIQDRKEKFMLMYIFVHRGDAISGHYWGYGRNGKKWYRFDVNCVPIKEQNILIDIQKSNGTPYAFVYAKQDEIQCFAYPYYKQHPKIQQQQFFSVVDQKTYEDYIPKLLKTQIIEENKAMHESVELQRSTQLVEQIIKDYSAKYNIARAEVEKYKKQKSSDFPLHTNLSFYFQSINQTEFMKYSIFANSLYTKTKMTYEQLLQNENFLKKIQKSFKSKIKDRMSLRHFAIQCQPKEGALYKQGRESYLFGKRCVQFIRILSTGIKDWPKIQNLSCLLEGIANVLGSRKKAQYLMTITKQLLAIILIQLTVVKIPIRASWIDVCDNSPLLKNQLKQLKWKELQNLQKKGLIQKIEIEREWGLDNLVQGFQIKIMQGIVQICKRLDKGCLIQKANTKEKRIVTLQQLGLEQPESLI